MKKIRVMVLYGGRSGEHEVSLRSAASVIRCLDSERYEIVPVAIDPQGKWHLNSMALLKQSSSASLPVFKNVPTIVIPPYPENTEKGLIHLESNQRTQGVDVVFPVMHGTFCEDGTLQGFLELADLPYVGCGVLSSAIGMDKEVSKRLAKDAGIPIVPYVLVKQNSWENQRAQLEKRVETELGYPVFVKPVNSGSSVGTHKCKSPDQLDEAVRDALRYDTKVLIEKGVAAREIEFSVLEDLTIGKPPRVSEPGEIVPTHEFYSYEAKYLDEEGAKLLIPAPLSEAILKEGKKIARDAFVALECEGMARVDLFLDKNSGKLYFNEINTIPGFTSISMYPKLWEYSGLPYKELLSQLIQLAISRHERKKKLLREYHAGG